MSVKRKSLIREKEEKQDVAAPAKPKKSLDLTSMPDAIVDGKFVAEVGDELIVERHRNGKLQRSYCEVKKVEDDIVHTWDITAEQWFVFKLNEATMTMKVSRLRGGTHS